MTVGGNYGIMAPDWVLIGALEGVGAMLRIGRKTDEACGRLSRRSFLRVGTLSPAGADARRLFRHPRPWADGRWPGAR